MTGSGVPSVMLEIRRIVLYAAFSALIRNTFGLYFTQLIVANSAFISSPALKMSKGTYYRMFCRMS